MTSGKPAFVFFRLYHFSWNSSGYTDFTLVETFEHLGEVLRPWRPQSIKVWHGGGTALKFQEIRDMAKGMGIKNYNNMKKVGLICAIQKAENNSDELRKRFLEDLALYCTNRDLPTSTTSLEVL